MRRGSLLPYVVFSCACTRLRLVLFRYLVLCFAGGTPLSMCRFRAAVCGTGISASRPVLLRAAFAWRDAVLLRSRVSGSGVRVAVRMFLYAVSGAPLSVFWMAFGPVLPVDYPGADQLVAVVPRGELPCGDAALRPVEDDVTALLRDVQHAALQRLPVADAHREAGAAARL